MKKLSVIFLILLNIVILSFLYKAINISRLISFPLKDIKKISDEKKIKPELFLFLYFSQNNCHSCLEIIKVLNKVEKQFKVIGVVPPEEFINKKLIRSITGATFKIVKLDSEYKRFSPSYFPSIMGVNRSGRVLFVLSSIPYETEYLKSFLTIFYARSYGLLI